MPLTTAVGTIAADFWIWWTGELAHLLPRRPRWLARREVVAPWGRSGLRLPPDVAAQYPADVTRRLSQLLRHRRSRDKFRVVLDPDRFLARSLGQVRLPHSRLQTMAELDAIAATPFCMDTVRIVVPMATPGAEAVYYVVRNDVIIALQRELAGVRLNPTSLQFGPDGATVRGNRLALLCQARPQRRLWSIAAGMLIIALIGTGARFYAEMIGAQTLLQDRIGELDRRVAPIRANLTAQAERTRSTIALSTEKRRLPSVSQVIEELSARLPDDAYLTGLDLTNGTVSISGMSASAADLLPILASSRMFSEPAFTASVVRDSRLIAGGDTREKFTIVAKLRPPA